MNDKTMIINKLSEYYCNGNDSEFARKLGITPQTLSNWKARNTIDYDLIYTKCENLNADWLLSGNGKMVKMEYDISVKSSILEEPKVEYGTNWKDRYIQLQEEVMQLQKKIIQMQEEQNAIKSINENITEEDYIKLTASKIRNSAIVDLSPEEIQKLGKEIRKLMAE